MILSCSCFKPQAENSYPVQAETLPFLVYPRDGRFSPPCDSSFLLSPLNYTISLYGHFRAETHLKLLRFGVRIGEIPQSKPTFETSSVPRCHYGSLRTREDTLKKPSSRWSRSTCSLLSQKLVIISRLSRLPSSKSLKQALLTGVWIRFARRCR